MTRDSAALDRQSLRTGVDFGEAHGSFLYKDAPRDRSICARSHPATPRRPSSVSGEARDSESIPHASGGQYSVPTRSQ